MKGLHFALLGLFLAGCGLSTEQVTQTKIAAQTQTQVAAGTYTPSTTPSPNLTETQMAIPSSTSTQPSFASLIFTEAAIPTTTAIAKAEAILTEIRTEVANNIDLPELGEAKLVFGPKDNVLSHTIGDFVIVHNPGLVVKNFVVNIRFINPYDTSTTGKWDYGVLFRNQYANDQYRLVFLSNQSWTLRNEHTDTSIYSSNDKNINSKAGEENRIWLIAIETKAYLFINGIYTRELNIGDSPSDGDISPAIGLYYGNLTERKSTEYQDFTIWRLP